jgi:hypothetical protein
MATSEQISLCKDLNVKILNKVDVLSSNAGYSPSYINNAQVDLNTFKQSFTKNNCDKVLIASKLENVDNLISKYSDIDKIRIESESIKQRNYRLILGAFVLISGLLIVVTINKKV